MSNPSWEMLRPYVPQLTVDWLATTPEARHRAFEGSLMSADISGFTALSEQLAGRGKVGAEELTEAIGSCFESLLAVSYANGGSLIKFGGDALLLLFRGEDHQLRACRSAAAMQREIATIGRLRTSAGPVTLRMSVGVNSGEFDFFLVGDSHRELIVTGPAATTTVRLESAAEAGEVLISRETARALPDEAVGAERDGGFLLDTLPPGGDPASVEEPDPVDGVDLLACIPESIRDVVTAGVHEPEHRQVTIAFIHFDGADDLLSDGGPEGLAEALDGLVRDVQRAVAEQGISFLATDISKNGGKIILSSGAPRTYRNADERMLLAASRIAENGRELPLRIGVNHGHVFAGEVGPFYRRSYTVMGDAVNLTARVMAAAQPNQLLATADVVDGSRMHFATTPLAPFHVKGKTEPVRALAVEGVIGGRRTTGDDEVPLVGRDAEMATLTDLLQAARDGRGAFVEIVGDVGIGKTRLLTELERAASDITAIEVDCELYGRSVAYFLFYRLLRGLLGMTSGQSKASAIEVLRQKVSEIAPDLEPWIPLLGVPLGLDIPPTPEVEQLDERFRKERLERSVVALLGRLLPDPTLITIEDAHWVDDSSADLLRRLANRLGRRPWMICTTRHETGCFADEAVPEATIVRPQPLTEDSAAALIHAATHEDPLPSYRVAALTERAGGNPLFLTELISVARTGGALPESIEAVVMEKIDHLAPDDRWVLRCAAVLGSNFDEKVLASILGDHARSLNRSTWRRLDEFVTQLGPNRYEFRHALVRDTAYEGLAYRRRRALHGAAGQAIETAAGPRADERAELLSLHFFEAGRFRRAWKYSRVAGERAEAKFANADAVEFLERAIIAARRIDKVDAGEVASTHELLGDIRGRIGAYTGAAHAYGAARRLLSNRPLDVAGLMFKEGWIRERSGKYADALRWFRRGINLLEGMPGRAAAGARARLMAGYAAVRNEQGKPRAAAEWCRMAIREGRRGGAKEALAQAYFNLDWALFDLGEERDGSFSEQALAIYEEIGDLAGQAVVLNNMGAFAYFEGRWDEARELFERGREAREKTGDEVNAAYGTNNAAEILSDQGRLIEAEEEFREALRVWRAAGYRSGVAFATANLARAASRAGRFDDAIGLFRDAQSAFAELGEQAMIIETDARLAECLVFRGSWQEALTLADATLRAAESMGGSLLQAAFVYRLRGYALAQAGKFEDAREQFARSLDMARSRQADYEVALTLNAIADLAYVVGDVPPPDVDRERDAIFGRLGVVSVPTVPLAGRLTV